MTGPAIALTSCAGFARRNPIPPRLTATSLNPPSTPCLQRRSGCVCRLPMIPTAQASPGCVSPPMAPASGRAIGDDTTPPYEVQWDMAGVPDGATFLIGAEIYDGVGNRTDIVRPVRRSGASVLSNGDFEQGHQGWHEYSNHGWPLIYAADALPTGVSPHAGQWAAWLGGDYSEISVLYQQVIGANPDAGASISGFGLPPPIIAVTISVGC